MLCHNWLLVVLCVLAVHSHNSSTAKTSDYKSMDHFCRSLRQSELLASGQHKICLLFLTDWLATWHEAKDTCLQIQDLFGAPEHSRLAVIRDEHQFKLAVQRFMEQHRVNMEFWVGAQQSTDLGDVFWHTSKNQTIQFDSQCEAGNKPNSIYSNPNSIYSNPNSIYSNPNSIYSNPNSVYSNQSCLHTNAIQPINTLQTDNCTQQKAFICEFASDQIEREDITCSGWGNLQYFCDSFHGSHYDSQNDVCLLFSRHSANFSEARRNCEKVFPEIFQKNAIDRWMGAKSDESAVWKWIMDEPKNDYCGILAAKENKCARSVPDGNGGLKMGEADCDEIKEFVCEFSSEPSASEINCKAVCPNIDLEIPHNLQVVYEQNEPFPSFTSLTLKCADLWVPKKTVPERKACEGGVWEELPAAAKDICYEPCGNPLSQHLQLVGGGVIQAVRHNEVLKVTGKCDHPWIRKDVVFEATCDDGSWIWNNPDKKAVCYAPCVNFNSDHFTPVDANVSPLEHNQYLQVKCVYPWSNKGAAFPKLKCVEGHLDAFDRNAMCHKPCTVSNSVPFEDKDFNVVNGVQVAFDQVVRPKCTKSFLFESYKCGAEGVWNPTIDQHDPCKCTLCICDEISSLLFQSIEYASPTRDHTVVTLASDRSESMKFPVGTKSKLQCYSDELSGWRVRPGKAIPDVTCESNGKWSPNIDKKLNVNCYVYEEHNLSEQGNLEYKYYEHQHKDHFWKRTVITRNDRGTVTLKFTSVNLEKSGVKKCFDYIRLSTERIKEPCSSDRKPVYGKLICNANAVYMQEIHFRSTNILVIDLCTDSSVPSSVTATITKT